MNKEKLCNDACKIIISTGLFIKEQFGKVSSNEIEFKQKNHLVSHVDKNAEIQLVEGLNKILPEATFLAEEGTIEHIESEFQWIIDPLDGTTNFLHSLPFFSISVALQKNNKTILGIVHDVMHDDTYFSFGNGVSYLNNNIIKVSNNNILSESLIATGFPYYDFEIVDSYSLLLKFLMLNTRGVRRIGSAALDLVYTASGKFDAYFEHSLSPWDVAAGAFIVEQANGTVTDFTGKENYIHGREIVAGNLDMHNEILKQIHNYIKN